VARSISESLGGERLVAAADTVLALAGRDFPDSTSVAIARGDLHLLASNPAAAVVHYARTVALAPADTVAQARHVWARSAAAALAQPLVIAAGRLPSFVGVYGPRTVTLENGKLFYQRAGGRKFALIPMSDDTFTLDGNLAFRVKFVMEGAGPASKVIGLYHDGRRDENERT
jgi:hypothetical protein